MYASFLLLHTMDMNKYQSTLQQFNTTLQINTSYDTVHKEIKICDSNASIYFVDGFAKDEIMQKVLEYFIKLTVLDVDNFEKQIPYIEVSRITDFNQAITFVLSGGILLIVDGIRDWFVIDARTYPNRSIGEPEDDRVLRGSRDGFVETLVFNTALIRRRIRDPKLVMQLMSIGTSSHTDIVISYISDRVDEENLKALQEKLSAISISSLTLAQESLAECLIQKSWWNPFPRIRYTERPDNAAANLLEGKIIVLVDNSPSAMIFPTSFFDFIQDTNDFYFPPLVGTYLRWVRFLVFSLTLLLTPLWYLVTLQPDIFPKWIHFVLIEEMNQVPILVQLLIVEFMIDAIKLASLNTPSALSGSFGVIGALVLGEFAIKAHWFVPEVLLYMSFVSLANFTQPSYELGYSFKFFRIGFLILISIWKVWGLVIGLIIMMMILITTPAILPQGYLYPVFPFNGKKLKQLLLRVLIHQENS